MQLPSGRVSTGPGPEAPEFSISPGLSTLPSSVLSGAGLLVVGAGLLVVVGAGDALLGAGLLVVVGAGDALLVPVLADSSSQAMPSLSPSNPDGSEGSRLYSA